MNTSINLWEPIYIMDYKTYKKKFRNRAVYLVVMIICIALSMSYLWFTLENISLFFKTVFAIVYLPFFVVTFFLALRYQRFGIYDKGIVPPCKYGTDILKFKVAIRYYEVEKIEKFGNDEEKSFIQVYRFTTKRKKVYDIDTEQILWTFGDKQRKKYVEMELRNIFKVFQFIYDKWKNTNAKNSFQLSEQEVSHIKGFLHNSDFQ